MFLKRVLEKNILIFIRTFSKICRKERYDFFLHILKSFEMNFKKLTLIQKVVEKIDFIFSHIFSKSVGFSQHILEKSWIFFFRMFIYWEKNVGFFFCI